MHRRTICTSSRALEYTVSHLVMHNPPAMRAPAMPSGATLLCSNAPSIPPWYFRALYREVGRAHEWTDWLRRSDAELESFVTAPGTILTTLLLDGAPRGFYMLRCEQASAELLYFGLTPDALGRQLGGPLLRHAVQAAWEEPRLQGASAAREHKHARSSERASSLQERGIQGGAGGKVLA